MTNKDNQRYIYIRSTGERIPVTEDEFHSYYNEVSVYRRKQQRHGLCFCPKDKWLTCDTDCDQCPYRKTGDNLSLDFTVSDDEGNEKSWLDNLPDDSPLVDEIVTESVEMQKLFAKLCELMPEAVKIGELRLDGLSDETISKEIGIGRKTFLYRLKKTKQILESEFPEKF